jgi:hypothetical protein
MFMGVYPPTGGVPYIYKVCQWCDIHTGVGFCVARSDDNGQSRASECGTSDGKAPTLFSYLAL